MRLIRLLLLVGVMILLQLLLLLLLLLKLLETGRQLCLLNRLFVVTGVSGARWLTQIVTRAPIPVPTIRLGFGDTAPAVTAVRLFRSSAGTWSCRAVVPQLLLVTRIIKYSA
jgi:hypothetical protein